MNIISSPQEVPGSVLSSITSVLVPESPLLRRLVPATAMAIAAISLSACSTTTPGMIGQVDRSTEISVSSTQAGKVGESPTSIEIPSAEFQMEAPLFDDLGPNYLTGLLRDLPWSAR